MAELTSDCAVVTGKRKIVLSVVGGGLDSSGGIGRFIGNLQRQHQAGDPAFDLAIGNSRGSGPIWLSPFHMAALALRMIGLKLSGRLALVHLNLASRGSTLRKLLLAELAGLLGVPVALHLHGAQFHLFYRSLSGPFRAGVRHMFRRAARIYVLGESWRGFVVGEVGVPAERVMTLYNGVAAPTIAAPARTSDAPCHIIFLGRLGDRKGVPELLQALAQPAVLPLSWTATLAGDGEIERFREMAASLGLADRIVFPGWVSQEGAATLLRSADLFVLPSYNEGLPMAVIEALSYAVPVIVTPVGTLPEVLESEQSGLIVPCGDVPALTDAIARLVGDATLRQRLGAAGEALFQQHFSIGEVARKFEDSIAQFTVPNGSRR